MKPSVFCTVIVIATAAGIGIGWVWRDGRKETSAATVSRIMPRAAGAQSPANEMKSGTVAQEHAGEVIASEMEKLKTMSVEAYGRHMADVWLDHFNADSQLRSAFCLASCDADQAMAFYREIKRRRGLTFEEWPGGGEGGLLCDFLIVVGKREGKNLMNQMMAAAPRGVPQLESLMHGWAAANPHEAVDWINALPADSPYSGLSLRGLMWGLSESSPATALEVFRKLDPADRSAGMVHQIVAPTLGTYGVKGLVELVSGIADATERQTFYTAAVRTGANQPPAEFVKWLAEPLETAPYLKDDFSRMAGRWSEKAPDEAVQWLKQAALKPGGTTALSIMAASLARQGRGEDLKAWLAANPRAPGRAGIESAVGSEGRASE